MPKLPVPVTARDVSPLPASNVVTFPIRNPFGARDAGGAEILRLTVRREVTTLELERRIER